VVGMVDDGLGELAAAGAVALGRDGRGSPKLEKMVAGELAGAGEDGGSGGEGKRAAAAGARVRRTWQDGGWRQGRGRRSRR